MDATDSSPRRTSSIIRRFSSIERSRLPPRVSVCFASSSVEVSISSPKWTRTPCPSLRTHHRRMRCQGSDGGDRTLTLARHTAEVLEGRDQPIAPVLEPLRVREPNEGRSAVAERGDECEQAIAPATDRREVRLHLQARLGLKPYDRIGTNRLEWADICLELADPAGVARRLDLAQQDRCRNPVWTRLLDALEQMRLEGIELAGPRFARPVLHLHRTTQVLAHRVTR